MDRLDVYIPTDRLAALARNQTLADRATGAALFADISGFTPLTEALASELGPQRGAEELSLQLDKVYDKLIGAVHHYGGSVIGFSGDAITCWFDADDGRRAIASAVLMQRMLAFQDVPRTPGGKVFRISIKVAVTTGPVRRFVVGRPDIQAMDVLAGGILDRLAAAEHQAQQGEVVVSAAALAPFSAQALIREWRTDAAGERVAVIDDFKLDVPSSPWPLDLTVSSAIARNWVPALVYIRLQSGQGQFLAELRPAVTLFLKFSGIDYDGDDAAGQKLDAFIRWVQTIADRVEGSLLQLTIGDKGSYLCIVFGAPIAHEDDAARAVSAALDLRKPPAEIGFIKDIQIGIGRGQMRVGDYGSATRRTYAALGKDTNIAARLMERALPGQILMTSRIAQSLSEQFELLPLEEPLVLKGVAEPIKVFTVNVRRYEPLRYMPKRRSLTTMVGRAQEQATLAAQLQSLLDGQSSSVIIEGEAGTGKSRLVADLLVKSQESAVKILIGEADAVEKSTPYYAWRPIFTQVLGLDTSFNEAEETARSQWPAHAVARLEEISPDLPRLAPLLNAVLPLDMPENELTLQMTGEVRAANTHQLLLDILNHAAQTTPLLLVLDDGHWLDSASWALIRLVSRDVHPALLIVAARPLPDPPPAEYTYLITTAGATVIQIGTLSAADVDQLICERLGVDALPRPVADLIHQKAEGHPFFSEELAYALRDAGLIEVSAGKCQIAAATLDLAALDFPDTIQDVITSRIDHLTPQQQLALKVASVIGRLFAYRTLNDIHPIQGDKPYLPDTLDKLDRLDLTPLEIPGPDPTYIFKHIITQEVAYNLMTFTQKRNLHRMVAEWFEQAHATDLSPFYPYLAYHWQRAVDDQTTDRDLVLKAINYLEKAAEQARLNFANREVVSFLSDALVLDNLLQPRVQPLRRARWERSIGDAYLGLGQFENSRHHLQQSLALLGQSMPTTRRQLAISMAGQTVIQVRRRVSLARRKTASPDQPALSDKQANWLEAARTLTVLSNLYFFANEMELLINSLLRALNLAEVVRPSAEVAQAASSMSVVAGLIGWYALADTYVKMARESVQAMGQLSLEVYVLSRISLYQSSIGRWQETDADLNRVLEISDHLNDHVSWIGGAAVLSVVNTLRGRFVENAKLASETCARARRIGNESFEVWGLDVLAGSELNLGHIDEASRAIEAAAELVAAAKGADRVAAMSTIGVIVRLHMARHNLAQVEQTIDQLEAMVADSSPTSQGAFTGYDGLAETVLALWNTYKFSGERTSATRLRDLELKAQRACQALHRYARAFPVARPRELIRQGTYFWLADRQAKALHIWQKALVAAEKLEMSYDQGMAHHFIGRNLNADDPARTEHLGRAAEIFATIGAVRDLALVQADVEHA